jgi:hypothetical protein
MTMALERKTLQTGQPTEKHLALQLELLEVLVVDWALTKKQLNQASAGPFQTAPVLSMCKHRSARRKQ